MSVPQSADLKNALWQNSARTARTDAISTLSRILGIPIAANAFTGRAEFEDHMQRCQSLRLHEERFRSVEREAVSSRLCQIKGLGNAAAKALLFFGQSSSIGGLRVPSTPSAETILSLLDWDKDDVFVFDASDDLIVHVDVGEDWLKPEEMGVSPREMLYLVRTPTN